jgi:hypothetical protein
MQRGDKRKIWVSAPNVPEFFAKNTSGCSRERGYHPGRALVRFARKKL